MKAIIRFVLCLIVVMTSITLFAGEQVFRGEIADSSCAMNVHSLTRSHKEMLKGRSMGSDAKSCANYCVHKMGAVYMLKTANDVYHVDDQKAVEQFAGGSVAITGVLDAQTHTIHVTSVKAD
jgi:hypothetical protein